jgi:CDP-glucose 4,6-dehydratase
MEVLVTRKVRRVTPGGPDPAFWRGRKVLVTGHTGFIGGWTCAWLDVLGSQVTGLALPPPTRPSFYDLVQLTRRLSETIADISSPAALGAAFGDAEPEIVRFGHEKPVETFATNVMGTVHVLDQVRQRPVRAVVMMTSDKVYRASAQGSGYVESDRLGPADPYGSSKACCELVAEAYAQSFLGRLGVGVATVRAGNVIGGGDWGADRLVPDAVRAFASGRELALRRPASVRPWQHVLDAVCALLVIAQTTAADHRAGAAWNVGPPSERSVTAGALATMLAEAWGGNARLSHAGRNAYPETEILAIDAAKARRELALNSPWSIEESVARTASWYKRALAGEDAWAMSLDQIRGYEADRLKSVQAAARA